jgi:hypothetical protein
MTFNQGLGDTVSLFTHLDDDMIIYHHHLNHFANVNFKNESFNSTWVTLMAEHEPYIA